MTEVDRLEYLITAENSKAVQAFQETGQAYENMNQKLSTSANSQWSSNIASGAGTAKGAIGELTTAFDNLSSKIGSISAGQAFSAIETGASKASIAMRNIGIAATVAGVPIGMLGKSAVDAYAQLESQITRDVSLIGGGKEEYQQLLDLTKELGKTTPFNAVDIAEGVESLAAAGYKMDQIKASIGTVSEMAVATGEPLQNMSDILVNSLNAFGENASESERFANVLAVGANESTASVSDIGESLKYAGTTAHTANKSIEETSAALAVMANNGQKGTMAGTGIVELFSKLSNPSKGSKKALAALGLTPDDINPATHSLGELLTKLNAAGLGKSENLQSLYKIFGNEAAPKVAGLISDSGLQSYLKIYDEMKNKSDGAMKQFADSQKNTLKYAQQQISESFQNFQLGLGEGLKPYVLELNDWLQNNQQTINDFAKNLAAGAGPAIEKFLSIIKKVMDWFNSLPKDMQAKVTQLTGLGAALTTIGGPLLLLGSIPMGKLATLAGWLKELSTVGGAGVGLTTTAGGISTLVRSLGELSGISAVKDLNQYLVPIGPALAGATTEAGLFASALAALGGPVGVGAIVAVSGALAAYSTNFGDFRDNINDIIKDLGSAAGNISTGNFEQAGEECAKAFGDGFETVTDLGVAAIQNLPSAISSAGNFISGASKAGEEFGRGIGTGAVQGVESMSGPIAEAIRLATSQNAAQNEIPNAIKGWFSGFTLTEEGKTLGQSLMDGFLSLNYGSMAEPLKGAISGAFDEGLSIVKQKMADLYNVDLAELNSKLATAGVGGEYLASHGNKSESSITGYYSGINTVSDQRGSQFWSTYASHNSAYGSSFNDRALGDAVKSGAEAGTKSGAASGILDAANKGTGASKTDPIALLASDKTDGNYAGAKKMYESSAALKAKYDDLAKAADKDTEATDDDTETTKTLTASKKKAAEKFSSYEEALADANDQGKSSFSYDGDKYKRIWDEDSQAYEYIKGDNATLASLKKAEEEKKQSTDKLIAVFDANTTKEQALAQLMSQYKSIDDLKQAGNQVQIGNNLYNVGSSKGLPTLTAADFATALVDKSSGKSLSTKDLIQEFGLGTSFQTAINTVLDKYGTGYNGNIKIGSGLYSLGKLSTGSYDGNGQENEWKFYLKGVNDSAKKYIESLDNIGNGYYTSGKNKGQLKTKEMSTEQWADYSGVIRKASEGTTDYTNSQNQAIRSTESTNSALNTTTKSLKSFSDKADKFTTTSDQVCGLGPVSKESGDKLKGLSDQVGQIDLKSQFEALFSNVDFAKILNDNFSWRAADTIGRNASSQDTADAISQYKNQLTTNLGSDLTGAAMWLKNSGETLEQQTERYSNLWYKAAETYLRDSRGIAASTTSNYDWTWRKDIQEKLSGDDYQAINTLFDTYKNYLTGIYGGQYSGSASGPFTQNYGDYWYGTKYSLNGIQDYTASIEKTGNSAEDQSKKIFTFSDAVTATGKAADAIASSASSGASGYTYNDLRGKYQSDKTVPTSKIYNSEYSNQKLTGSDKAVDLNSDNIHCVFYDSNLKMSDSASSQVGTDLSSANKSYIEQVMASRGLNSLASVDTGQLNTGAVAEYTAALQLSAGQIGSDISSVNGNLSSLDSAIQNLASISAAAVSQINDAISRANSILSSAVSSRNNLQSGEFSGPQTTTQKFATGGPVTQTGKADVEAGEWILRRDQVRNAQTGGGNTIQLITNMQGSKFGDPEMSKDLPQKIARQNLLRLKRAGLA